MKYIILIPAYEPDEKLLKLLKDIDKKYLVIVIDDGSGNEYKKIFDEAKKYSHVISYEKNMGKGYAIKLGLNYINDNYKKYIVVTMDADGQHRLSDAIKLYDYVKDNLDCLVLGKRLFTKDMPIRSKIGNFITRKVFKIFTKLNIYDTQTGLRAFSYKLNHYMVDTFGDRYEYEMNVLLGLKDNNIKYKEIPIETIYYYNNKGSHFNIIKDSYLIYKNIFNYKKKKKE